MTHCPARLIVLSLAVVMAAPAAYAQTEKKSQAGKRRRAFLSAKEAGPDFQIQGEYAGGLGPEGEKEKFGVQIVALGEGNFHLVAYPGGLPGAGWTGEERIEVDGRSRNGEAVFKSDRGTGVVQNGRLEVTAPDGTDLGALERSVRKSPTLGRKPPKGAVVLFPMKADLSGARLGEGEHAVPENFKPGRISRDGLLLQGCTSRQKFQSCRVHLEFMLSYMPYARGQARSNSGVYLQGRYEVQILDSFGLEGRHNECGGIYEIKDPDVNMCLPPLQWQTYDVEFTAAKFDDAGKKTANAKMSVWHNGVQIHKDVELPRTTRAAPLRSEGPEPGPLYIQDHGNPLRFRNIWLVEKK